MAISDGDGAWFLVNASPDLRAQIDDFPPLQPGADTLRQSPISGVLLTNADLDHTLGVLLLREGEGIALHAPRAVRETLNYGLGVDRLLAPFSGAHWHEPPQEFAPLFHSSGEKSGLSYRAIPLPGGPPPYASAAASEPGVHGVAYQFLDPRTGGLLLVAPDVGEITPLLGSALEESDVVLFDGTFWSDDELQRVKPSARTARQMGHLPIQDGSLELLRSLPAREKVYVHINNTNPILAPDSPERAEVEDAGLVIGEDGMDFQL